MPFSNILSGFNCQLDMNLIAAYDFTKKNLCGHGGIPKSEETACEPPYGHACKKVKMSKPQIKQTN